MPQVDREAFVFSVCGDRKIACEPTDDDDDDNNNNSNYSAVSLTDDLPPESYLLSKDVQLEWLSDNAFFGRKHSQKGNYVNPNPSSQRFLLKSRASIIGLPKPQETCFNEAKKRRHNNAKNRIILKRVGSLLEPSSPMVSCIGRVRSKRERNRMHRRVEPNRVKKPGGLLAGIKAIFRIGGGRSKDKRGESRTPDIWSRLPPESVEIPVVPGLAGMTRFASGRRADLLDNCNVYLIVKR